MAAKTPVRDAVTTIGGQIADAYVALNRVTLALEEHEEDKQAGHAHRLLALARLATHRAEVICTEDDRYLFEEDEWDFVYLAMSVVDKMATTEYPMIEQMLPGAVRALANETSTR